MSDEFRIRDHEHFGIGSGTRDWLIQRGSCTALTRQGIEAAGITELGTHYELIRSKPQFANLVVCCDGTVDFLVAGEWVPSTTGTVLVAPHGVAHGVRTRSHRALTAWVAFEVLPQISSHRGWDIQKARLAGVKDYRPLFWALQGLYTESTSGKDPSALGHWTQLVVYTSGRLADYKGSDNTAALRPTWDVVDADLARPWTAESIAELANLSPSHFRRLCRQRLGRSPSHHLAHLRMQRAAVLLTATTQKLASIATSVGYENTFAFSVAFKRWSGLSPAHYRTVTDRPAVVEEVNAATSAS